MTIDPRFTSRIPLRLAAVGGLLLALLIGGLVVAKGVRVSGSTAATGPVSHASSPGPSAIPAAARPAPIFHTPLGASGQTGGNGLPLLIALHGGQQTPHIMEVSTGLDAVANANGFMVAYLGAAPPEWRASADISYVGAMITWIENHYPIDRTRVYLAGFSRGGHAVRRAVCQFSNRIAGVAVVSQAMAPLRVRPCRLTRPVSQISITGSNDAFPWHQTPGALLSSDQTASIWRGLDQCSSRHVLTQNPPAIQTIWSNCADGTKVGEYVINGGVHTWPVDDPARASQSPDYRYDASRALWRFLAPMRLAPATADGALTSLRATGARAKRTVIATLRAGERLTISESLRGSGRTLAAERYRLGPLARATASLPIPSRLKAGRYAITLTATDTYGRRLRVTRTVHIPG